MSSYINPQEAWFPVSSGVAWVTPVQTSPTRQSATPTATQQTGNMDGLSWSTTWSPPAYSPNFPKYSLSSNTAETQGFGPNVKDKKRNSEIEEELTQQNLYKTELCRSWVETGSCRYGIKCQFAHGKSELRPIMRHPKYKTEICKTFHTLGTCPYGTRCRFIHHPSERNPNSSSPSQLKKVRSMPTTTSKNSSPPCCNKVHQHSYSTNSFSKSPRKQAPTTAPVSLAVKDFTDLEFSSSWNLDFSPSIVDKANSHPTASPLPQTEEIPQQVSQQQKQPSSTTVVNAPTSGNNTTTSKKGSKPGKRGRKSSKKKKRLPIFKLLSGKKDE